MTMPTDDTNFEDELRALVTAGRKIEAVQRYRAATGAGLADAKRAVESLMLGNGPSLRDPIDSTFENQILSLLKQGKTIPAIKLYREKTGVGLKQAKDFIEALAADQGIVSSRPGCLGVVLLLVLIPLAAIVAGPGKAHQQPSTRNHMDHQLFEQSYQGQAPWDIGLPQPAIIKLAETGQIRGSVLDVGCGTGENLLCLAARGHEAWGLDFVPVAIERAQAKAAQRKIAAHFLVGNALELTKLGRQFDTVIDCGLFHTFTDEERPVFVNGLGEVLGPGGLLCMLCFSDEEPGTVGPRRISQQEIRDAFRKGWKVQSIEPVCFDAIPPKDGPRFSPGGPKAWLARIERT